MGRAFGKTEAEVVYQPLIEEPAVSQSRAILYMRVDAGISMKNIEMFYILAISLFFLFVYFLFSADPNFGFRQTINLFCVFGLIAAVGALIIRRITRKRTGSSVDETKLTYLNLGSDSELDRPADEKKPSIGKCD
jgi:hypothetical protein